MFHPTNMNNVLRGQILEAESANDSARLVELAAMVPLNRQLGLIAMALLLPLEALMKRRNDAYAAALSAVADRPALSAEAAERLERISLRETNAVTATEAVLEIISWKIAAEYQSTFDALNQSSRRAEQRRSPN